MHARSLIAVALLSSCGSEAPSSEGWQIVHPHLDAALLSVWGTSATDVWAVGADPRDGQGPLVLRFDGAGWSRLATGQSGDLWWVFGFEAGPVYLGGAGGTILRWAEGELTRLSTPGTGTVFGIWGATPDDVWAVGGQAGGSQGAFAWRLEGDRWNEAPGFPAELSESDALWKVFGRGTDDVWMVGTGGKTLHWNGTALEASSTGIGESLFTVHAHASRFAAVGGFVSGLLLERAAGAAPDAAWTDVSPPDAPALVGVCLTEQGGYAVGQFGYVAVRDGEAWREERTGLELEFGTRSLHSVWVDPGGGIWAAGGQVLAEPLLDGILIHKGRAVPARLE